MGAQNTPRGGQPAPAPKGQPTILLQAVLKTAARPGAADRSDDTRKEDL